MSYHGLGLTLSQTVPDGIAPISQPAAPIASMVPMNYNPMIPSVEYAAGDQAMMLEMQSRTNGDPAAMQQAYLQPGIPSISAPVGPTPVMMPASPLTSGEKPTKEQLYEALLKYWKAILAGQQPSPGLESMQAYARDSGQGYLSDQAENFVMSGGAIQPSPVPAGIAPVQQPSQNVAAAIQIPQPGMPSYPIPGIAPTVNPIYNYSPETGLNPAQPSTTIQAPPPPPPTTYAQTTAPIYPPSPPPTGYIPDGTPQQGQIPMGPGATANVPQGQLPPQTQQYVQQYPQGYQQSYTPPTVETKTNYLPIIAIAVGAFLLAKMM